MPGPQRKPRPMETEFKAEKRVRKESMPFPVGLVVFHPAGTDYLPLLCFFIVVGKGHLFIIFCASASNDICKSK